MRWMHRFNRPMGIRYPINWDDRIRNYMIGRRELGLPVNDLLEHMRAYLGAGYVDGVISSISHIGDRADERRRS